jgi:hypothetical protein
VSHSPANSLVNSSIRTFTQLFQVQVRRGCPKREALPLLKGNGEGWGVGRQKGQIYWCWLSRRWIRQNCGALRECAPLKVTASFPGRTPRHPSGVGHPHSPTGNPAAHPPPEKNRCYSVALYSPTSQHRQPEVPWGEMKSWNVMLLLGLLARGKKAQE